MNTARVWTSMMAALLGSEISNDVPEHEVGCSNCIYIYICFPNCFPSFPEIPLVDFVYLLFPIYSYFFGCF